jgi:cell division protein FtsN
MARRKRSSRKDQAPGWIWMLFGLSVGLAVALFVYLQGGRPTPLPAPESTPVAAEPVTPRAAPEPAEMPAPQPVIAEPEQEADTATRLDFYERLRTLEVSVPDGRRGPGSDPGTAPQLADEYTIQAGAFRTPEEADSRRATLALLAIDSHLQNAIVQNVLWHRVIIGPLSDIDEIDRILRRLESERIDALPPRPVANQ